MKEKKSPITPPYLAPTSGSLYAGTPPSSSSSSSSSHSSSSPSSVLSSHSSLSTSCSPPPRPSLPTFSFLKVIRRGPPCRVSSSKNSSKGTWVNKLFKRGKLSMEAAAHHDEGLLLQKAAEGFHGSWGDADDEEKVAEKPKKELRFAAKIAAAMDADGFIGVKNCVCADDRLKHSAYVKKGNVQYCAPSPAQLQRSERVPLKQARPRRRWRLLQRIRRTRVLFACMFQKVRKAFTCSSKRSLTSHSEFIKRRSSN